MAEQMFSYVLPAIVCAVGLIFLFSRRDLFGEFLEGAREGIKTALSLAPALVPLVVALKMLNASGAIAIISSFLAPVLSQIGIESELLPLLLTRPFSGSASMATYSELLKQYGPDSFVSFCASVIMGSSDTVVYVIALYFSSVGVKKSRYAFPVAFLIMLICVFFSSFICRLMFK